MKLWMARRADTFGVGIPLVWETSERKVRQLARREWGDASRFIVKQFEMPTTAGPLVEWLNENFKFRYSIE